MPRKTGWHKTRKFFCLNNTKSNPFITYTKGEKCNSRRKNKKGLSVKQMVAMKDMRHE